MAVIKPVDPNEALKQSQNSQIDSSWIGSGTKTPADPMAPTPAITGAISSGLSGLKNNVTHIATGAIK